MIYLLCRGNDREGAWAHSYAHIMQTVGLWSHCTPGTRCCLCALGAPCFLQKFSIRTAFLFTSPQTATQLKSKVVGAQFLPGPDPGSHIDPVCYCSPAVLAKPKNCVNPKSLYFYILCLKANSFSNAGNT